MFQSGTLEGSNRSIHPYPVGKPGCSGALPLVPSKVVIHIQLIRQGGFCRTARETIVGWTTLVEATSLQPHINDPDLVVVDCRFSLADPAAGRALYEAAHLPGARFADLD